MKHICVFCGASPGIQPGYVAAARGLGAALARRGLGLVYGGGRLGLMGAVATGALEAGGKVIGIIPTHLVAGEGHHGLTELRVVGSMHERKAAMAELADAFIALPGGFGTLEEFFEVLTWAQLGLHFKPCGLLNVQGFYDPLLTLLDHTVAQHFVDAAHRAMVLIDQTPEGLLSQLAAYRTEIIRHGGAMERGPLSRQSLVSIVRRIKPETGALSEPV